MDLSKLYIKKKFYQYYSKHTPILPKRLKNREFAIVPIEFFPNFVMIRHLSFTSELELKKHILAKIPSHIYYSSAYYQRPYEDDMEKKGWIGADLIFDIDSDHLPIKTRSMERALELAKRELKKLVTILRKDFGIREEDMRVFFSGGRGYHVHVFSDEYLKLSSIERREIIDYITLNSPNLDYNSNVSRRLLSFTKRRLKRDEKLREKLRINPEELDGKDVTRRLKRAIDLLKSEALIKLKIHIDAPVTADIRRLIRLPGSLHGKTGLRVTEVEDIDSFDPLTESVVFGEERARIKILKKVKFRLFDHKFCFAPNEIIEVPEYVAVFLICQGLAKLG